MRNVVEITGVNTANLKTLSSDEIFKLLNLCKQNDIDARNELIEGNLKLVLSVVKRFNNRADNLDDLFQVGCIGLIKAIDNFDLEHGVKFSTYAVPMIIGEIRRYLRDNSKLRVPRSLKDIAYKALQFKESEIMRCGKEPNAEEIAKHLSLETIDVIMALESMLDPVSIYTPIYSSNGDDIYLCDQLSDSSFNENDRINQIILEDGLKALKPRLRYVIDKRFYENMTQMEVALELGISQAQVSRLEKSALKQILEPK